MERNKRISLALISLLMGPLALQAPAFAAPNAKMKKSAETSAQAGSPGTADTTSAAAAPTSDDSGSKTELSTNVVPDKMERIEVTGSHIKRLDTEGVAPVATISKKEIEESGFNSVTDIIRGSTASSFGAAREASGANDAGNAYIDLHGMGADKTLVLLNGQRLPTDATTGLVDTNMIPTAAIERVEIVKDGASAIYGSDALGGVVNIITKKDFKGTEASVEQTVNQLGGGARTQIGVVNGINTENLNVVNVVQFRNNATIYYRDRDWRKGAENNLGAPGTYVDTNGTHADPSCPPAQIRTTQDGTYCAYNFGAVASDIPSTQQISAMSDINYQLSSGVKVYARLGGTQRDVKWNYAPAAGSFKNVSSPNIDNGTPVTLFYRTVELGTRDQDVKTYGANVLAGTKVDLPKDMQLEVTGAYSLISGKSVGTSGYALSDKVKQLIQNGTYNPAAPVGQKGSLAAASYQPVQETTSVLASADAKLTGEVAQLPAGPIGFAVGTQATHQDYNNDSDLQSISGNVFGGAGGSGKGQRNTQAVFAEGSIPVATGTELQIAGRYDHYSDFGSSTNPKVGLVTHLTPSLLVRGSVGTGFKAPNMQDLYAGQSDGQPTFIDHVKCAAELKANPATATSCQAQQYEVKSGGNTGLKEEKSLSYNAGAVWEPSRNFNLSSDFFYTKLNNVVGLDLEDLTIAEQNGAPISQTGVQIVRDPNTGAIDHIVAPLQNLSRRDVLGMDLSGTIRFGRFKYTADHSQMFFYKEEGFPGAGFRDKLGEDGRPAWRNTETLAYVPAAKQEISLSVLTTASQLKSDKTDPGNIPRYASVDLGYNIETASLGTFSIAVKNVLNTTPPLDDTNPLDPMNTALYDPNGRTLVVGYRKAF